LPLPPVDGDPATIVQFKPQLVARVERKEAPAVSRCGLRRRPLGRIWSL
jgi:hypothetical protein